jgi:hypothetical protein
MSSSLKNFSSWLSGVGILLLLLSACHKDDQSASDAWIGNYSVELYGGHFNNLMDLAYSAPYNESYSCKIEKKSENSYVVSWYTLDTNLGGVPIVTKATLKDGHLVFDDADMNFYSYDLVLEETKKNAAYGMCMDYSTSSSQAGGQCRYAKTFKIRLARQS